ncbi:MULTISPECIES: hypothetical protein [unclassified Endozoicomonas]|uniref:hypothetical protein n=1 Tax=unclassified Endozoicomonas TaxID=2644528 RepID=UPI003BB7E81E
MDNPLTSLWVNTASGNKILTELFYQSVTLIIRVSALRGCRKTLRTRSHALRVSQNFNSSFSRSEVVIPAKAGIQRQRWISAFSGMTRPGGHRAVWFWWRVSVDSRLRGNDENEIGNDENEIGNDENEIGNDENEIGNDGGEGGNQSFATASSGKGEIITIIGASS